jgi:hypothetical protein
LVALEGTYVRRHLHQRRDTTAWALIPEEGEKSSIAEDLIAKRRPGSSG